VKTTERLRDCNADLRWIEAKPFALVDAAPGYRDRSTA
jgi:hypothetical protein